ncbi:MAG: hypothetical protein IKA22_00485 [Lentisphaeria bacterium]|nr:hypothetical protein [Lentisphaeria bacterium]
MRQTDPEFIRILNVLRTNDEEEITTALEKLNSRVTDDIPKEAVYLCSTKKIAAARNAIKFTAPQQLCFQFQYSFPPWVLELFGLALRYTDLNRNWQEQAARSQSWLT